MKRFLFIALTVVASFSALAEKQGCEDDVDLADSLDFYAMHIECADDPVTLYDPKSKAGFMTKGKVVSTYEKAASKKLEQAAVKSVNTNTAEVKAVAVNNAGMLFNIREPFTITGGPQSALNGLYVQMVQYCPAGWSKEQEWVEPAESGYFLHYQFRCAAE